MTKIQRFCMVAGLTIFSAVALPAPSQADTVYNYGGVVSYSVNDYTLYYQPISSYSGSYQGGMTLDIDTGTLSLGGFAVQGSISFSSQTTNPFSATGTIDSSYQPNGTSYGNFTITDTTANADISSIFYVDNYSVIEQTFVTFYVPAVVSVPEPSSFVLAVTGALMATIFARARRSLAG